MAEHLLDVKAFPGIDNTSDLASVSRPRKAGVYFYEIDNIDIDDNGKPHRRKGFDTPIFTGTNVRSIWANDNVCLFAEDQYFCKLNDDNSVTILIYNVDETDPFCYVANGDTVYFSNNSIVGYVNRDGNSYPFPDPNQTYKVRMVGGHILEWYNSRLYAGNDANLFYSDAAIPTRMDTRKNAIAFHSRLTMVKAVDNGIYVSDSDNVYYEGGMDATAFVETKVLNFPAIEGMSVATVLKKGKAVRRVVYWMTKYGPYAGYNDGTVVPMQGGLFHLDGLESGTAVIKDGAYQQLTMVGKYKIGYGGSGGVYDMPPAILND